jgi:hypothetical protein
MSDWGKDPVYINRWWTEELLTLMFIKRTVRIKRLAKAQSPEAPEAPPEVNKVSDKELFAEMKLPVDEVTRGNRIG